MGSPNNNDANGFTTDDNIRAAKYTNLAQNFLLKWSFYRLEGFNGYKKLRNFVDYFLNDI